MTPLRQGNPIDAAKLPTDYTKCTDLSFMCVIRGLASFSHNCAGFLSKGGAVGCGVSAGCVREPLDSRRATRGGFTRHLHRVSPAFVRDKQDQTFQVAVCKRILAAEQ